MIRITELCKNYGEKTVIDRLTLCLPEGRITAVCGPSGSGKSTLLSVLAGLDRRYSGTVAPEPGKMKVSMSFQDPCLLPWRTAEENVNIVLGDKKATLPQAEELLSKLGIYDFKAYPDELSGGMKARVAISRALAVRADQYFFDEPFAALDADTASVTASAIRELTEGKTCIAVIHDIELAGSFADTVIRFDSAPLHSFEVLSPRTDIL